MGNRGVVWVVGAGYSNGIGGAVARELDRKGYSATRLDIRGEGDFIYADVTVEESVRSVFERAFVKGEIPKPFAIVNSAGYNHTDPVSEYSIDNWNLTYNVNVRGIFLMCREFVRYDKDPSRTKFIVNIGSDSANIPHINSLAYCSSKAAVQMMTRCLARDLAPLGYRIMEVQPSLVSGTNMDLKIENSASKLQGVKVEDIRNHRIARCPMGRYSTPDEIARWVPFLLENEYANGACIRVTGGVS